MDMWSILLPLPLMLEFPYKLPVLWESSRWLHQDSKSPQHPITFLQYRGCSLPSDSWMLWAVRKISFQLKGNLSLSSLHPTSPILCLGTSQKGSDAYFIFSAIRYLMSTPMSSQTLFISRLYSNNGNNVNIYCTFSVLGTVLRALHMPFQGLDHK